MNYQIKFARGQWRADDWQKVRSPRWAETSHWKQLDNCIANALPTDMKPEDMQMGRDRTGETYISMLLKKAVTGSCRIATTCAFDDRMAPLLVFSQEFGPVHHDHLEVVLYDHGINLWHHYYQNGQPSWKLLAFGDVELQRGEAYKLTAEMRFNHKGTFLTMDCQGHTVGCRLDTVWPETYYVGFTGCEGRNRFYDFSLKTGVSDSSVMNERFSD